MRSRLLAIAAFACVAFSVAPSPAQAWGFEAHKYIMRRAIDLLPPELKPFFERNREEIVIRVTDPDLWRTVGWPEDPNHFLDFGVKEYGVYPFAELPREYDAALAKFGRATLERNGTLPWRLQEISGNLRRAFEGMARNNTNSVAEIILFSAVSSHYIQDAHQPLHATDNYDGGQTGQPGIHGRFERELFERYRSRLTIEPAAPKGVASPRDAAFDTLLASFKLVDQVLAADKQAVAGRQEYDGVYYDAFFAGTRSLLEQQLGRAITATASIIIGAWEHAGKPAVRLDIPSPVQRVKPAR